MVKLINMLKLGYFPKELPPPFTTGEFGTLFENQPGLITQLANSSEQSHLARHSLFRAGNLRRLLSVPNPSPFLRLSKCLEDHWEDVESQCARSPFSLSTPGIGSSNRAIVPVVPFNKQPIYQANLRAKSRFILKTDIANFYPSIYTHSIPWALHTKAKAKRNHGPSLWGNQLDKLVRDGQHGQSIGIPIGTDTSLAIAEMLLSSVDEEFYNRMDMKGLRTNGFRSYDDYELGFTTRADAETAITILQSALSEYELQLNPSKTTIIELPIPIEPAWVSELRTFRIQDAAQTWDLRRYFDRAFELSRLFRDTEVLKYAVQRLRSVYITEYNWPLCESLLLQCGMVETSALPVVIDHLHFYRDEGYKLRLDELKEVFHILLNSYAPLGHGSEVAWLLWGCLLFGLRVEKSAANAVADMEDPFAALLLLHTQDSGLIKGKFRLRNWRTASKSEGLRESQWLLSYEANIKGWISSKTDYVSNDNWFHILKKNDVYFYDTTTVKSHAPSERHMPGEGFSGGFFGGGGYPGDFDTSLEGEEDGEEVQFDL